MVDLRELWAWFVFYVLVSVLAIIGSFLLVTIFSPLTRVDERSVGPLEQQFYLLLIDRASWVNGNSHDAELREGMTEDARAGFNQLLNDVRFEKNCIGGGGRGQRLMSCFVNGYDLEFLN